MNRRSLLFRFFLGFIAKDNMALRQQVAAAAAKGKRVLQFTILVKLAEAKTNEEGVTELVITYKGQRISFTSEEIWKELHG